MTAQWDSLKLRHLGLAMESSGQIKDFSSPELNLKASLPKQHLDAESASHWPPWLLLMIPVEGEVHLHKTDDKIRLSPSQYHLELPARGDSGSGAACE